MATVEAREKSVASVLGAAAAAVAMLFLLDAALFRTPWYYSQLEPNSSAGQVEGYLYWLNKTPRTGLAEVAVFGDSRIAHGFSAPMAGEASENRIRFWNFGIAGTLPRDWYYMLRDADPGLRRFAAVFLALDQYSDEDYREVYADRIIDLNFLVGRLRLTDCWGFAASMKAFSNRERALLGCVFKGVALQEDFLGFLSDPLRRMKRAADWREHGLEGVNGFAGINRDLSGLAVDWRNRKIDFPPGLDEAGARPSKPQSCQAGRLARERLRAIGSDGSQLFWGCARARLLAWCFLSCRGPRWKRRRVRRPLRRWMRSYRRPG